MNDGPPAAGLPLVTRLAFLCPRPVPSRLLRSGPIPSHRIPNLESSLHCAAGAESLFSSGGQRDATILLHYVPYSVFGLLIVYT